jgi:hypothetical protein
MTSPLVARDGRAVDTISSARDSRSVRAFGIGLLLVAVGSGIALLLMGQALPPSARCCCSARSSR